MSSVPPDDSASLQRTWLVFALGPYVMCASALDVEGIIQCPDPIAKLPLTPDYALGAFLFRGRSAAAISLRRKLRLGQGEDLRTGPFIVTRIGGALVAFWVDEVKDVLEEKDAAWRPMPSMLDGGLFERFAIRETELILQTSFAALREAQVEFESLASWIAVQADATPPASGEAASQSRSPAAAVSGGERSKTEYPQSAARQMKDDPAEPRISSATPHAQPNLPSHTPFTPKLEFPARAPVTPRASAGRVRVAGEERDDPTGISRKTRAMVARAPERVKTVVDTVAAPEPRSVSSDPMSIPAEPAAVPVRVGRSSRRLVIALALAMTAIAAFVYLFLPLGVDERQARQVASAARPSTQGAISPAALSPAQPSTLPVESIDRDQVTLAIERRGEANDAKVVDGVAAAQLSTVPIHTVVRGDTLWQIAKQQVGDPFRYPELAKLSDIRDPDRIRPGDVIRIEIRKQR